AERRQVSRPDNVVDSFAGLVPGEGRLERSAAVNRKSATHDTCGRKWRLAMQVTEDTTTTPSAPPETVKQDARLPLFARIYVAGVISAGALVLVYCATHVHVQQWALFVSLV